MPNHTENIVTIVSTNKKQLEKFKKFVHDEKNDSPFSFQKIVPMPEALKGTLAPAQVFDTQKEVDDFNKEKHELMGDAISLTKSVSLIRRYGFNNWYDWAWENWGTKWDAYDVQLDEWGLTLEYRFNTAWNGPVKVRQRLESIFDNINMNWICADEENYNLEDKWYQL